MKKNLLLTFILLFVGFPLTASSSGSGLVCEIRDVDEFRAIADEHKFNVSRSGRGFYKGDPGKVTKKIAESGRVEKVE